MYSSRDGITDHPAGRRLREVEQAFNLNVVYGHRTFKGLNGLTVRPEVLLIDVTRMDLTRVNDFKRRMYDAYRIPSDRYEDSWEFDQYVKLAPPAVMALHALGACNDECTILAHEFMGMPTALAAMIDGHPNFRTLFYAHEVAPMRKIVEEHEGHDTMFYNALRHAV